MRAIDRDGQELYRFGHGSLRKALADVRQEIRHQGIWRGALRAFFKGTSGLGYLITGYPAGGWEFVDYLVHSDRPSGLDRLLFRTRFARGIRHRAELVRSTLFEGIERLGRNGAREAISILDVGCGVGTFSSHALACASRFGRKVRVLGVDRDPRAVTLARRLAKRQRVEEQLSFERRDALAYLRATEEQFDLVLCIGVLAYLPDGQAVHLLGAIRRRMREGGVLLASHLSPGVSRAALGWLRLMGLGSLRSRTLAQLEELLRRAGFERIQITLDASGTQNFIAAETASARLPSNGPGEIEWIEID